MNPFIARLEIAQFFFAIPAIFNIVDRSIVLSVLSWLQYLASDPANNGLHQNGLGATYTANMNTPGPNIGVEFCHRYATVHDKSGQLEVLGAAYALFGPRLMHGSVEIMANFSVFCQLFSKQYPHEPNPEMFLPQLTALVKKHKWFHPEISTAGFAESFASTLSQQRHAHQPSPPKRVFEKIARPGVPALDDILGLPFEALSDGFIRVIDYMGNDASIVQAARVSYGAGTKTSREDSALIDYLMRKHHTTPFEMCEIKLHIRMPMDSWRQQIRNRSANVNEYSTRYSVAIDACDTTKPDAWRLQSTSNKQGSGADRLPIERGAYLSEREHSLQALAREVYEERLAMGVAREQARKDLPLSNYTEAYWKIDLHNLLNHFLALRMNEHAQLEIRSYANIIGDIVAKWVPATWAAFQDHRLSAMPLSGHEIEFVSLLLGGNPVAALAFADEHGLSKGTKRGEVEVKLKRLGAFKLLPWT